MSAPYPTRLADRIADARRDAKLTQAALARSLGVTRSAISQYESGKNRPSLHHLRLIAELTRKPLSWFLIEDAATAMRAAESAVSDSAEIALKALPPAVREVMERKLAKAKKYADTLPSWARQLTLPPGQERDEMLRQIESDIDSQE